MVLINISEVWNFETKVFWVCTQQ